MISRFLPSEATSSRSSSVSSLFSSLLSTLYTTTTAAEISTRKQLHTNTATRYLGTVASENLPLSESLYLPSLLDKCLVTSRSRRLSVLTYVRLRTQRTPTLTIVTKRETIKKTQTQKQKQNKNKTKSPNYQKKVDVSSVLLSALSVFISSHRNLVLLNRISPTASHYKHGELTCEKPRERTL